jgi:hypothetical protein
MKTWQENLAELNQMAAEMSGLRERIEKLGNDITEMSAPFETKIDCETLYLDLVSFPELNLWDLDVEIDLDLIKHCNTGPYLDEIKPNSVVIRIGKVDIVTSLFDYQEEVRDRLNEILKTSKLVKLFDDYQQEQQDDASREPWF